MHCPQVLQRLTRDEDRTRFRIAQNREWIALNCSVQDWLSWHNLTICGLAVEGWKKPPIFSPALPSGRLRWMLQEWCTLAELSLVALHWNWQIGEEMLRIWGLTSGTQGGRIFRSHGRLLRLNNFEAYLCHRVPAQGEHMSYSKWPEKKRVPQLLCETWTQMRLLPILPRLQIRVLTSPIFCWPERTKYTTAELSVCSYSRSIL